MRLLAPPPETAIEPLAEPPTFSIVIAAYEAAETVGAAVRSALEQTLPAHQVIVVDDGSTDDLASALQPYGDHLLLVRQKNRGAGAARNAGAAAASGDFVATLDADDTYHPRRLEVLASLAQRRPDLDLITTDARFLVDGKETGTFSAHTPFVVENQRTAIFESCFVGGWPALRLARFRRIDGFDESLAIAQDWDCWLRAILDGAVAGLVDLPYYNYAVHPGSLSSSRTRSLWERVQMLENAAGNPSLRELERPALKRALRIHRSRAVDAEVQDVLYRRAPRTRLTRLIGIPRIGPRARLKAVLGLVAPPLARRLTPEDLRPEERLTERR